MEPAIETKKSLPTYGDLIANSFGDVFTKPFLFGLMAVFALISSLTSFLVEDANTSGLVLTVLVPVSIVASILNIVATMVVIKSLANPSANIKDLWKESMPQVWSYWWLMVIYTLITTAGLLFFVVPGVILMGYLCLVLNVAALEHIKGLDVMVRSTELIKGYWWAVALRTTAVVALMFLAIFLTALVFGVLIGALGTIIGFGEREINLLSAVILEPVIVAVSTIVILSTTNKLYQSLLGGEGLLEQSKVKLRRFYKIMAIIGPVMLVAMVTLVSYAYIEYGFMSEEVESLTSPSLYEEVIP